MYILKNLGVKGLDVQKFQTIQWQREREREREREMDRQRYRQRGRN
jgi:hypothetical protein